MHPTDAEPKRQAPPPLTNVDSNMDQDGIVAIGLLTRRDLTLLGPTFDRLWPVEDAPDFAEMLRAIDTADEELRQRPPPPRG